MGVRRRAEDCPPYPLALRPYGLRMFWFAKPFGVEDIPRALVLTFMNSARHIVVWFWLLICWRANAAAPGDDWPMFRGGPALAGVAAGSLPERLELLWTFKTGGPVKSLRCYRPGPGLRGVG